MERKNKQVTLFVLAVVTVMAVLPWVYAPLYRKVCGVLGIPVASNSPFEVVAKTAREGIGSERAGHKQSLVNFMGVSGELPIDITPLTRRAWIKAGQTYSVTYRLTNLSDRDLDYRAVHMVAPQPNDSFQLIKCFCDEHRIIKARSTEEWPLTFKLVKPVDGDAGLTVNYTIFNFDPQRNKARSGAAPASVPAVKIGAR